MRGENAGPVLAILALAMVAWAACGGGAGNAEVRCNTPVDFNDPTIATRAATISTLPVVTLEEAQEEANFAIAQPAMLPVGLELGGVRLMYSLSCDAPSNVELLYESPDDRFSLMESGQNITMGESSEPVIIGGEPGEARVRTDPLNGETRATASWRKDGVSFIASAFLTDSLTEDVFFEILETIE